MSIFNNMMSAGAGMGIDQLQGFQGQGTGPMNQIQDALMQQNQPMQGEMDEMQMQQDAPIQASSQQAGGPPGMPGGMVGATLSGDSVAGGLASLFMGGGAGGLMGMLG